jgi:hypothetical protein
VFSESLLPLDFFNINCDSHELIIFKFSFVSEPSILKIIVQYFFNEFITGHVILGGGGNRQPILSNFFSITEAQGTAHS